MRGIDENRMFNRGLATTLAVLAACFGAGHPVHAGWTPPEELADLDRELPKLILKKRWAFVANESFGVSSILNPIRPRRGWLWITQKMCCWFISVQDRTPSVSSGRGLWSSPRNVKPFTLGFDLWTNGVRPEWPRWIKRLQQLEQHPDFETDPVLRLDRSDLVRRERDHRGPWLRFLALSYRMQLNRVEDLPIAPRDIRFEEVMPQDAMRREAAMWSTRLKSQTSRSNPGIIQEDSSPVTIGTRFVCVA